MSFFMNYFLIKIKVNIFFKSFTSVKWNSYCRKSFWKFSKKSFFKIFFIHIKLPFTSPTPIYGNIKQTLPTCKLKKKKKKLVYF